MPELIKRAQIGRSAGLFICRSAPDAGPRSFDGHTWYELLVAKAQLHFEFQGPSCRSSSPTVGPLFTPFVPVRAFLVSFDPSNALKRKSAKRKEKVVKKKTRKKVSVSPSPKAIWPPTGFKANGEVFAKIPTAKELIGIASNSKALTRQLAEKVEGVAICEKYSCGAVQLASLNGCTWWEITGKVTGEISPEDKTLKTFGTIRSLVGESAAKEIITVLLVSQEPFVQSHSISKIGANCHHDAPSEKIPSTSYSTLTN